jgi:hypothetical protein
MPRPSTIPPHLQLEATIIPSARALMRTEDDRQCPVKLFCTEKKVTDFKVVGHTDDYVTVEAIGYRYRIDWSNARDDWRAGTPPPERIALPTWVRVGGMLRYVGTGPLTLIAEGADPVIIKNYALTGRFGIVEIFARHLIVSVEGIVGRFRLDIEPEGGFHSLWAQATDNHNDRIKPAKFLTVGRRIMPIDVEGNYVGTTSYVVLAYDRSVIPGGVMRLAPLLGDGVCGSPIDLPAWNSAETWAVAPDDVSKKQLEAGMTIKHQDEEYEVTSVDPVNKQVTVERKQRERMVFRLGDPTIQVLDTPKPDESPDRFARALDQEA